MVGAILSTALIALLGCSNTTPLSGGSAPAAAPVYDAWTTPPGPSSVAYAAQPAPAGSLQPAPQPLSVGPTWSGAGVPPPPPPPGGAPTPAQVYAPAPVAVAGAPVLGRRVVPPRPDDWCGLACTSGVSQWHLRGVGGLATFAGDDPAENCLYYGADLGRTFCGCWGLDLYWRYNSGRFDRETRTLGIVKDGGEWQHFGAKLTYEKAFEDNGRLYAWGGLGGGYFTTDKYLVNDDGAEVFGEAGLGFVLNKNFRLRAGVNVHGMDTDVTRKAQADLGKSRWLWIIAPVVEIEGDF